MDWYPWYFTLYQQDTMHLDPYQDGCYRRLIDHYMITRAPLPDNDSALARIIGVSLSDWLGLGQAIVRPFFRPQNGLLFHKRCDKILLEQDERSKKLSESGKRGAEKRHNKINDVLSHPIATPKPNRSTIQYNTIQDKVTSKDVTAPSDVSDQVWRDFQTLRKAKKAPITQTVLNRIRGEAEKAGLSLQEAIEYTIQRGWQSFNAEWFKEKQNGNGKRQNIAIAGRTGSAAGEQAGNGFGGRKSQTEQYAEATDRIIAKRRAKWEAENPGQPYPSGPAIEAPATNLLSIEEIRGGG